MLFNKNDIRDLIKFISVAPPTQGTGRSDDYISAFRLMDIVCIL